MIYIAKRGPTDDVLATFELKNELIGITAEPNICSISGSKKSMNVKSLHVVTCVGCS